MKEKMYQWDVQGLSALSALATTAALGIGTVLGAIVGYVVSADLCYLVIQADINHQGIYIVIG